MSAAFRLAVLNPGGRDPEQDFAGGPGGPEGGRGIHPPVNFHGYAACVRGSFHARVDAAIATERPVLLLLRRDLGASRRALQRLKAAGRTVAVTFKETGSSQVAARLDGPGPVQTLEEIVRLADGCLASTPWMATFWSAFGKPAAFIPTPYPLEDPRWDFTAPAATGGRRGVLVGTREFNTPSRQHLAAVLAARDLHRRTGEPVSVFNVDGRSGAKMLAALGFTPGHADLRVLTAPLPYADYLRAMARHKLVFQLDRSGVPGQVAGDALLSRIPCVGGDGAIEQMAFASLCGLGRNPGELAEIAHHLLTGSEAYGAACLESRVAAARTVSNTVVAEQLAAFFGALPGG